MPRSNFKSVHRFVVQAWTNRHTLHGGWEDTIHGADSYDEAVKVAEWLIKQADRWVGAVRRVRIAESI